MDERIQIERALLNAMHGYAEDDLYETAAREIDGANLDSFDAAWFAIRKFIEEFAKQRGIEIE